MFRLIADGIETVARLLCMVSSVGLKGVGQMRENFIRMEDQGFPTARNLQNKSSGVCYSIPGFQGVQHSATMHLVHRPGLLFRPVFYGPKAESREAKTSYGLSLQAPPSQRKQHRQHPTVHAPVVQNFPLPVWGAVGEELSDSS